MHRRIRLVHTNLGIWRAALACCTAVALFGCQQQMAYQPSFKPQDGNDMFADGRAARPLVANTVYRGNLRADDALWTGKVNGKEVDKFPITITQEVIERGQQRFNIYCQPCHGRLGDGNGMVVQRGVSRPPSYTDDRLLTAPLGHFFDVITNGWGRMYPYDHVAVRDRWAIVAYLKALQLSQHATINEVPENDRAELQKKESDPPSLHTMVQQTMLVDNKMRPAVEPAGGHK